MVVGVECGERDAPAGVPDLLHLSDDGQHAMRYLLQQVGLAVGAMYLGIMLLRVDEGLVAIRAELLPSANHA